MQNMQKNKLTKQKRFNLKTLRVINGGQNVFKTEKLQKIDMYYVRKLYPSRLSIETRVLSLLSRNTSCVAEAFMHSTFFSWP